MHRPCQTRAHTARPTRRDSATPRWTATMSHRGGSEPGWNAITDHSSALGHQEQPKLPKGPRARARAAEWHADWAAEPLGPDGGTPFRRRGGQLAGKAPL